jgi:tRNA modification GTPase
LRTTVDVIEKVGIAISRREQERADLVLLVLDRSEPLHSIDRHLVAKADKAIVIANKADLAPAWSAGDIPVDPNSLVTISADRGDGVTDLIDAIVDRLVPDPPLAAHAVPFRQAHIDELREIRTNLLANALSAAVHRLNSMIEGWAHERLL